MAILDCPGRGECAAWCYSLKSWRNPNALGRQVSNSMLLRAQAGRDLIAAEFSRLKTETVRLYVDGDFHSKENLTFWMDLIKTRPDIQVYGYSKSWVEFVALHLSGYAWPENYLLNLSGGSRFAGREGLRQAMATRFPRLCKAGPRQCRATGVRMLWRLRGLPYNFRKESARLRVREDARGGNRNWNPLTPMNNMKLSTFLLAVFFTVFLSHLAINLFAWLLSR